MSQSMFLILVPYYCPILIMLPNDHHACLALPYIASVNSPLWLQSCPTHIVPHCPTLSHPHCQLTPLTAVLSHPARATNAINANSTCCLRLKTNLYHVYSANLKWFKPGWKKTSVEEFRNLTTTLLVPITRARKTATKGTHRPGWWFFIFVFSKIQE